MDTQSKSFLAFKQSVARAANKKVSRAQAIKNLQAIGILNKSGNVTKEYRSVVSTSK